MDKKSSCNDEKNNEYFDDCIRYRYPRIDYLNEYRIKGYITILIAVFGIIVESTVRKSIFGYFLLIVLIVLGILMIIYAQLIWPKKSYFEIKKDAFIIKLPYYIPFIKDIKNIKYNCVEEIKKKYYRNKSNTKSIFQYKLYGHRWEDYIHLPCELIEDDLKLAFGELWDTVYKPEEEDK